MDIVFFFMKKSKKKKYIDHLGLYLCTSATSCNILYQIRNNGGKREDITMYINREMRDVLPVGV